MILPVLWRAIGISFAVTFLASCSAAPTIAPAPTTQPPPPPTQPPPPPKKEYKVLFSFKGGTDGWSPRARLLYDNGELYGTTVNGGTRRCVVTLLTCGTIFKMNLQGAAHVLHRFAGGPNDGGGPLAGLTLLNGKFYGTTCCGGSNYLYGTVYDMDAAGNERVLYNFDGVDGYYPSADLTVLNGSLYGTTRYGGVGRFPCPGSGSCGNVFEVTPSGRERSVYSFQGAPSANDGVLPYGYVTNVDGVLYGTTGYGGTRGAGTVYRLTRSGNERVLYSFTGGADGAYAYPGLVPLDGELYGTTVTGAHGSGTVFKISTSGALRVLHAFKGYPSDGDTPQALIAVNGTLFGTTGYGGEHSCRIGSKIVGCGTVFEITTSGRETILHDFKGGNDGAFPAAALTAVDGTLYGTTSAGGTGICTPSYGTGCGTVFELTGYIKDRR